MVWIIGVCWTKNTNLIGKSNENTKNIDQPRILNETIVIAKLQIEHFQLNPILFIYKSVLYVPF